MTYLAIEFGLNGSLLAEYLLEALDAGVLVQDETGILSWNPLALSLLGLTEGQLAGAEPLNGDWKVVDPNGQPIPIRDRPATRVLRDGKPVKGAFVGVHRADGSLIWLQLTVLPIFGMNGKVRATISTFVDVTEVKTAATELERAERRFRSWFEDGLTANVVVEYGGRIVAWNRTATEILERSDGEMFDLEVQDLLALDIGATVAMLSHGDVGTDHVEGATHIVMRSGEEVEVDARVVKIQWPGHPDCVMIQMTRHTGSVQFGRDIEEWHRSAFDESFTSMLLIGAGDRISAANRSCGSLVMARSIDLIGRPLTSLLTLLDGSPAEICQNVRESGQTVRVDDAFVYAESGVQPISVQFSAASEDRSQILVQLISRSWSLELPAS
jgi:PAS domain S-box-containing protein